VTQEAIAEAAASPLVLKATSSSLSSRPKLQQAPHRPPHSKALGSGGAGGGGGTGGAAVMPAVDAQSKPRRTTSHLSRSTLAFLSFGTTARRQKPKENGNASASDWSTSLAPSLNRPSIAPS